MQTHVVGQTVVALYTPRQISIASFIGSPLAAAWFAFLNYQALAQPERSHRMLLLGVAATVVAMAVAFVLPERTPYVLWPLIYSLGIQAYATWLFGPIVERHLAAGGPKGSWWKVVGVGLAACVIVFGAIFLLVYLFPDLLPGDPE